MHFVSSKSLVNHCFLHSEVICLIVTVFRDFLQQLKLLAIVHTTSQLKQQRDRCRASFKITFNSFLKVPHQNRVTQDSDQLLRLSFYFQDFFLIFGPFFVNLIVVSIQLVLYSIHHSPHKQDPLHKAWLKLVTLDFFCLLYILVIIWMD